MTPVSPPAQFESLLFCFYSRSSPAATACGRIVSPVIPVAPNIATFLMESDIIRNNLGPLCSNNLAVKLWTMQKILSLKNHI